MATVENSLKKAFFKFIIILLGAAAYFSFAKFGLLLATINNNASPVWPASGFAIILTFALGYRLGFAIFLGAFFANLNTGLSLSATVAIAIGNSLEAVIGAYLFKFLLSSSLSKLRLYSGALKYALLAFVPTMVSASVGTLSLHFAGALKDQFAFGTWVTWWVGDSLGILMLFPVYYEFREVFQKGEISFRISAHLLGKIAFSFLIIGLSSYLVFATIEGRAYLFVLFLALLTVAMLLPFLWVYIAGVFITIYSIYMTRQGMGPFQAGATNDSLIHLELFLASLLLTCIVLAKLNKTESLRKPAFAFVIGWLMTGVTFYSFYQSSTRRAETFFHSKAQEATAAISDTMSGYVRLLEAGAGLLNTSREISRSEWNSFVSTLRLAERYPGIKGIGVIYSVPVKDVRSFERKWQKEFKEFKVHDTDLSQNVSNGWDKKFIITLLEPVIPNLPALGLDISSEENRKRAALQAAASGDAVLSQKISLIQSKTGFGYLLLVPIYKEGLPVHNPDERIKALKGFVYAPIESESFFAFATKPFSKETLLARYLPDGMRFSDVESKKSETLIETTTLLAGNPHTMQWSRSPDAFYSTLSASLVGFCGAFFTLVLATLIASLESIRGDAERIALQKTSEVEERERIWRTLAEINPVGIFLTDQDSHVIYVNKKWLSITGVSLPELRTGKLKEAIHEEDRGMVYEAWDKFRKDSVAEYSVEYRLYVDGKMKYVASYAVAIRDDLGHLTGYLGSIQDMTESRQNQTALATAARMSSLGQMAGGVAHEINSPLAIITGRAELLKMALRNAQVTNEEWFGHLQKIQDTVHRIAKIIRGLRSVSRDTELEPSIPFALKQTVQDALDLCENKFLSHGVNFTFEAISGLDAEILGRPEQISQVLLNLLNNAFDACADQTEPSISLKCYDQGGKVCLEVSDSGPGIKPRDRENLFNPFFTTKDVGQGMGLGLSISKSIIEKHGGTLSLDSERKQTTFVVKLNKHFPGVESSIN